MQKYRSGNYRIARDITRYYSTSFSLGISMLPRKMRNAICAIYAFVRYADEIVDTFEGADQQALLAEYKRDTEKALRDKISNNPVLDAFQDTVHEYQIPVKYIEAFLYSMEMDLSTKSFSKKELDLYIYGSAEVVGLMCLCVFVPDKTRFAVLEPYACALGAAFQKINFLRDVKSDYEERGRIYVPTEYYGDNFRTEECKASFEAEIEQDFQKALIGIRMLPDSVKLGVYLAYVYYYQLFKKIRTRPVQELFTRRIRISNWQKSFYLSRCLVYDRFVI
jgi:15-cis-phytoene synthase